MNILYTVIFGSLFVLIGLILLLMHRLLLPFVVGIVLAYLLLPTVDWLERHSWPRALASTASVLSVVAIFVSLIACVTPSLIAQLHELVQEIPVVWSSVMGSSTEIARYTQQFSDSMPATTEHYKGGVSLASYQHIAGRILADSFSIITRIALLLLTPIIAIYFINSWPQRTTTVVGLVPTRYRQSAHSLVLEVDQTLRSMLKGVLSVSIIMMVTYSVILTVLGVRYGLVIGVVSGMLSFIPFLGSAFGLISTALVASDQFWPDWLMILLACSTFAAGQVVADHIIAPQVMGGHLKMNPLWILFGVLAGGSLFGFLGMLLALPILAISKVVILRVVEAYKGGAFYNQ